MSKARRETLRELKRKAGVRKPQAADAALLRKQLKELGLKNIEQYMSHIKDFKKTSSTLANEGIYNYLSWLKKERLLAPANLESLADSLERRPSVAKDTLNLARQGVIKPSDFRALANAAVVYEKGYERAVELLKSGAIKPGDVREVARAFHFYPEAAEKALPLVKQGLLKSRDLSGAVGAFSQDAKGAEGAAGLLKKGLIKSGDFFEVSGSFKDFHGATTKTLDLLEKGAIKGSDFWNTYRAFVNYEEAGKVEDLLRTGRIKAEEFGEICDRMAFLPEPSEEAVSLIREGLINGRDFIVVQSALAESKQEAERVISRLRKGEISADELRSSLMKLASKTLPPAPERERVISVPSASFSAKKDLKHALKLAKAVAKQLSQGKSMTRDEALKLARKEGVYFKGLERALPEKISLASAEQLIARFSQEKQLREKGLFGAELVAERKGKAVNLLLNLDKSEMERVDREGGLPKAKHAPGSLAYARVIPGEVEGKKVLIVPNIQSDALQPGQLKSKLRKRYAAWAQVLMEGIEKYAKEKGYEEVLFTTPSYQMARWGKIGTQQIQNLYERLPRSEGYKLMTTSEPVNVEDHFTRSFWRKPVKKEFTPSEEAARAFFKKKK